jgi:hypothetical protein
VKILRCMIYFLSVAILSTAAEAALVNLQANLDGLQESPPNASPAFGLAEFVLNDVTGDITLTTGTYQDLLGGSTFVSLRGPAPPGTNANLILAMTLDTPGAATGTFSIPGGSMLSAPNIANAINGQIYINLNSNVFVNGEIRGQLFVVPEPSTMVLCMLGLALGFAFRGKIRSRNQA